MKLSLQKRLAATISGCSEKKVKFNLDSLKDIKEAITKIDIRGLIKDKAIVIEKSKGVSKGRTRKKKEQKKKGRQRGQGKRKGTKNAREPRKRTWINKIRSQRAFLAKLKEKKIINLESYRMLYNKAKGGYFRSKRHIDLYINEHNLVNTKDGKKNN